MSSTHRSILALLILGMALQLLVSGAAQAEAMKLADARPRWVAVRFEMSPEDEPGRLDSRYGDWIRARFEATDDPRRVQVTIRGGDVARTLFATENVRSESFSDFVWVFDVASGAVVSAGVRGTVLRRIGIFEQELGLDVTLTTEVEGGFRAPRRLLGQLVFDYCRPEESAGTQCRIVRPRPYDAATGYVNAVGSVETSVAGLSHRSFAPLGEAIFRELMADEQGLRLAAAPPL